jgi:quinoprotein relay system zinc metallohydrolase 1
MSRTWSTCFRCGAVGALLLAGLAGSPVLGQTPAAAATSADPASRVVMARFDYGLQARALAPGVWVVDGANADFTPANGCNIINTGFIATGAGVLVINTGPSRKYGEQLRALIARTTAEPVIGVLHLNLHPDYFLGNQAFADVPRYATAATRAGMAREAKAYEDNLYRLCGDWMLGSEALLPEHVPPADAVQGLPMAAASPARTWRLGQREFLLVEGQGHTASDLVLVDRQSGVAFVGGLVFVDRIPTTPHARVPAWLQSLDALQATLGPLGIRQLVPSHGPAAERAPAAAIAQTRDYLAWLDGQFRARARAGWDMGEVLRATPPAPFNQWAAVKTEWVRNVAHLYPVYEQAVLLPGR